MYTLSHLHPAYAEHLNLNGIRTLWRHRNDSDTYQRRQVRRLLRWKLSSVRTLRKRWGYPRGWVVA